MFFSIIAFLIALTVHEAAHAWMADRLGDPTARVGGRLSLNPLAHVDIYGTILVPLMLIFIGSPFVFGWAKPVMFDPYNLKNPRRDSAFISLAGPFSNFILATILAISFRLLGVDLLGETLPTLIVQVIDINIILGLFNLIPIHPLDGGKVFVGFLPEEDAREADLFLRRYGILILIFLIFPFFGGTSPLFTVLIPVRNFLLRLLLGSSI